MQKYLIFILLLLAQASSIGTTMIAATIDIPAQARNWNIPAEAIDVQEALEICRKLSNSDTTPLKYYVMGYVQKIHETHETNINKYGNAQFYLEQEKGAGASETFYAYRVYGLNSDPLTNTESIQVGDFVVIYGNLTNYNGTYETKANQAHVWRSTNPLLGGKGGKDMLIPYVSLDWDIPSDAIDVLQARDICSQLTSQQTTNSKYYIMGYVQSLNSKHTNNVTQYGNAQFYLEQEKGTGSSEIFYAYRVYGADNNKLTNPKSVQVGDFVVLYGNLTNYNGIYETKEKQAYIWRSTNDLLEDVGGDENEDDQEENILGGTTMQGGLMTIDKPAFWTYNELQSYIGQTVEFTNHFYVTNNVQSGQLTIAPRQIFSPTNQAFPLSKEYQSLLKLNPQAQVTLTGVHEYHRIGERLHKLRVKIDAPNKFTLISCNWQGNTRAEMEKGYDSIAVNMRGKHSLLLCYMNLEYYLVDNFGTGFGPENADAHQDQRTKVSQALAKINADIYGFVEVQTGQGALAELAADLTKNTGRNFTYINDGSTTNSSYTKSGYIYCTDIVVPHRNMLHNNTYLSNRKKIQGFVEKATGEKFILSVNHFKAKSGNGTGANADQDDGQGMYNAARVQEAQSIINNANDYQSFFEDEDLLIVGDLNAYAKEDPIQLLIDAEMIDLHRAFHADTSYSYVYKGQLGYLDHAICNESMYQQVTGMVAYHINSVEKDSYTYDSSTSDRSMFRCSDHDPLIIGICLGGIQDEDAPDFPNTPDSPNDDKPTDVGENLATQACRKVLRKGQIIILRNGKEYDIIGNLK